MKSKSVFLQIIKYFCMTLILPVFTIFLLYGYAENTVKEQMVLSGERTLTQFFALVDNVMEDISQTCISVSNEYACDDYIKRYLENPDTSNYPPIEVYKLLQDYMDENIFDIVVYYPAADRIVSAKNGSLPTEDYLAATYGRGNEDKAQYMPLLECESKKPRISAFVGANQQTYLCMNMRHTAGGTSGRTFIVSVVYSSKFLQSMMMQEHLGDEGTLMIFDSQKRLLLSGDGKVTYDLTNYDGTGMLFEMETGEGSYMMLAEPSQVVPGFYAYAMDVELFWSALFNLRMVCLIICALCLLLTVLLVLRGIKRVYSPIGTLVQRAEKSGVMSYNRKEHSEIQFVETILDKSHAERLDLQKQVKKSKNVQCDKFVRSLFLGNAELNEPDKIIMEKYAIPVFTDRYRVVLAFVEECKDIDLPTQDFMIHNVFEEVTRKNGYGYVVQFAENQYAMLINLGKNADAEEEMRNLLDCRDLIRQQFGLALVLASGDVHYGLANVCRSYEEATLAMQYKYLLEDADYIDYSTIKNREFSYVSSMESNLSRSIVGYINGKHSELSAEKFVSEIMQMCNINADTSMDNIECFKYEIISIINKVFMICDASEDRKEQIQELVLQPTLQNFRAELARMLEYLRELKMHRSRNEAICQKTVDYILENYRDPQLSIVQIGDALKLSPYYASKLFKESQEMSISDFIAKTRIEKAKEQLRSTDMSIKAIAEKNGFLSSNVFIRTFKKWVGITPGVYREQNMQEE